MLAFTMPNLRTLIWQGTISISSREHSPVDNKSSTSIDIPQQLDWKPQFLLYSLGWKCVVINDFTN